MDDFFKVPVPPAEPPEQPPAPEWFGPPDNVLPGDVGTSLVVARTTEAAVWLHSLLAYPHGLSFSLLIRTRVPDELDPFDLVVRPFMFRRGANEVDADGMFRFGVEFADGRRVTTLDGFGFDAEGTLDRPPDRPVLVPGGGGGGGGSWDMGHWLWPLPPPGPVTFACAWPAQGIPFTKAAVDGTLFVAAAQRAETLWEPQRRSAVRGVGRLSSFGGLTSFAEPEQSPEDDQPLH